MVDSGGGAIIGERGRHAARRATRSPGPDRATSPRRHPGPPALDAEADAIVSLDTLEQAAIVEGIADAATSIIDRARLVSD